MHSNRRFGSIADAAFSLQSLVLLASFGSSGDSEATNRRQYYYADRDRLPFPVPTKLGPPDIR